MNFLDRFDGIFESLRGFIGAFIGIFLVGGVILGIVLIIRNSKKPKYEQLKQQAYQQQAQRQQQYYNGNPQQGVPQAQGVQYQQGMPYPQQGMPYPPPQKSNNGIKIVVIALVLYFVVLPLFAAIVILALIFGGIRSCDRQRQQSYDQAIESVKLHVNADTPDKLGGNDELEKLFDSEYRLISVIGDYIVIENGRASMTTYGYQQGCRVLVDKNGDLVTPEDEYYTTIIYTEKLTYKDKGVIVCTDCQMGFYTPNSDDFDDQYYLTTDGKKISSKKLEYKSSTFGNETVYHVDSSSPSDAAKTEYHSEKVGKADVVFKNGRSKEITKEIYARRDEFNNSSSYVIYGEGGKVVFPKNASKKLLNEDIDEDIAISGTIYEGDVYKDIYDYDIDRGRVVAARYYPDEKRLCLGLYDLDGNALYEYSPQHLTFEYSQAYITGIDSPLCSLTDEYAFIKTDTGYTAVDLNGNIKKQINADDCYPLGGASYYADTKSDGVKSIFIGSVLSDNDQSTDFEYNKAMDGIIVFLKGATYSYYKVR